MVEQLSELIRDKKATVGVVGLGYVGLPLVHAFVKAGYRSIGFDVDPAKVKLLQEGKSYIKHFSNDWMDVSWFPDTSTASILVGIVGRAVS